MTNKIFSGTTVFLSLAITAIALITPLRAEDQNKKGDSTLRPDDRIIFIGDSITGLGWNNADGFIHQIDWALRQKWPDGKVKVIPLGGSGQSVTSWLAMEKTSREKETNLDVKGFDVKESLAQPADVVVIMLGMNDLLAPYISEQEKDLDAWTEYYRKLIAALRDRVKPRVIALASISMCSENPESPKNKVRTAMNARVAGLAKSESCIVLPVGEEMLAALQDGRKLKPDFHVTYDFVHPNKAGHLSIAMGMLKGLGEDDSASKLADKYLPGIRKEAAGATPVLSWQLIPVKTDSIMEKKDFLLRFWYCESPDAKGKETPNVKIIVPENWTATPALTNAFEGEFKVSGPADRLVSQIILEAATSSGVRKISVPVPAPWIVGTVVNPEVWPGNKFDPVKDTPLDENISKGIGIGVQNTPGEKNPSWRLYFASPDFTGLSEPGSIDFTASSFGALYEAGYAVRWIHSDKERPINVVIGTQTFAGAVGIKAWLNGKEIYAKAISSEPGKKASVEAKLLKGSNCLVMKCCHLTWQWQASLKLEGKDGDSLDDLKYSTSKENN
ncbi:MAG: GDSL-type esterase/lipase family protein [Victivallales bacterium]